MKNMEKSETTTTLETEADNANNFLQEFEIINETFKDEDKE